MPHQHPKANYSTQNHANYNQFKGTKWDSCEETLAVVRDTHWQALVAAALLEDRIERLCHFLSHGHQCSGSQWHSGSHRHSGIHWQRSQTVGCQTKVPQLVSYQGETKRRQAQSPSPMWLRQQVTFEDSPGEDAIAEELPLLTLRDEEGTEEPSDWSRPEAWPEEEDLKCPPALDPLIQEFLPGGEVPWASDRIEDKPQQTSMSEPSPPENCWVDLLVHTAVGHASLVARTLRGPWPRWHPEIHQEGAGILSGTKSEMPCLQSREWLLCTTSTPFPGQGLIPVTPGYEIWQPGLSADAASKDPGLCKGPPTLGGKSPATNPRQVSSTARKWAGAQTCYGTSDHIYQCGGSGWCPTL